MGDNMVQKIIHLIDKYCIHNNSDYEENAFELLSKKAELCIIAAQYQLGECYSKGIGVKQDYEIAIDWYSKAAKNNNAPAQRTLAAMNRYGIGMTINLKQAFNLYSTAANMGDALAQCILRVLVLNKIIKKRQNGLPQQPNMD